MTKDSTASRSGKKFHLPWVAEWREDFLEASRILSRERHADEIAQRLIYRLRARFGDDLSEIRVLACVTTPAMLLAAALHRWWPIEPRPAIADLGYYLMLSKPKDLPVIVRSGRVLVVQDVIDTHRVSGELVTALMNRGIELAGVLGFVRMVSDLPKTQATAVNYWWEPTLGAVPHHALIEVRKPSPCDPPQNLTEDNEAFWIEPRSLHPFRYKTLRRDFAPGRDRYLDRRDEYLERFDGFHEGCLLTAGHYVYGRRHFAVTVDIRRTLTGTIGDELAGWLADICEGRIDRPRKPWESPAGSALVGDVTAVLMPLHSQIHYVWPKVENLLAQRGRRQHNWWLEATLFTGAGPHYLLPAQFEDQIYQAVKEAVQSKRGKAIKRPLRILILDDAIASAQTAENVLTTIMREVRKAFDQVRSELSENATWENIPNPIQWIRYFAVLNQMDNSRHYFWRHIPGIGRKSIPFVLEEFAPFMGVPIYDDNNCPACHRVARLKRLRARCVQCHAEEALQWIEQQLNEVQPIAVDGPDFQTNRSIRLSKPIEVLSRKSRPAITADKFRFRHADTAIWRFHELMYLSYPPNDVLHSLKKAWPSKKSSLEDRSEYERYRWAVLNWCLDNWPRIRANAAEPLFAEYARKEMQQNTSLVERVLEAASVNYSDKTLLTLVADLVTRLAELERQREEGRTFIPGRSDRVTRLDIALTLFFLSIPEEELKELHIARPAGQKDAFDQTLLTHLDKMARTVSHSGHNLLRNLFLNVTRPQRYAHPTWALEAVAESLFRGRDPNNPAYGSHELLPKLISEVRGPFVKDVEKRRLLRGSLATFLGALEDIKHYSGWQFSAMVAKVEEMCTKILDWLKLPQDHLKYEALPGDLPHLEDALRLEGEFCSEFNELFHASVEKLGEDLKARVREKGSSRLNFSYVVSADIGTCRVLTNVNGLVVCLANRAIDPISDSKESSHKSRIEVERIKSAVGADRLEFLLLTNFASLEDTVRLTEAGASGNAERTMLETFGARFDSSWTEPSIDQRAEGFTSSYKISVLAGFIPKGV